MGGWLAAEMAVTCSHVFSKLMLVDPVGIKPQQGEITDIFIISRPRSSNYCFTIPIRLLSMRRSTADAQSGASGDCREHREMAVRLCWKPYMYDPRLPGLLSRVNIPTRIVWGQEDRLVPLECAGLYQKAIPGRTWWSSRTAGMCLRWRSQRNS